MQSVGRARAMPPGFKRRCRHCGAFSAHGKEGPADSEYAHQWFCDPCWRAWDRQFVEDPEPAAASLSSNVNFDSLPVRELRNLALSHGVNIDGCVEKADIILCLSTSGIQQRTPIATAVSTREESSSPWESMSIGELRRECQARGINIAHCVEKVDIVNRLRSVVVADTDCPAGFKQTKVVGEKHEDADQTSMRDILQSKVSDIIDDAAEKDPTEETVTPSSNWLNSPTWTSIPGTEAVSLRDAVLTFDVSNVERSFASGAPIDLDIANFQGRGLLHICAMNATKEGVGSIVRFLLSRDVDGDTPDFAGRFPLQLAIEETLEAPDPQFLVGLDTIRTFVSCGAKLDFFEIFSADSTLVKSLATPRGTAIEELLTDFGATLPWRVVGSCASARSVEDDPVIIEFESDTSEVGREDLDSDGIEEVDMEASWRAAQKETTQLPAHLSSMDEYTGGEKEISQMPAAKTNAQKPLSLRAAVKAFNIVGVRCALEALGCHAEAALDATDGRGRTLLHLCGAGAANKDASGVVGILLQNLACAAVQDTSGQTPLMLAISAGVDAPTSQRAYAVDTVQTLLAAGIASKMLGTWHSETCPLACAYLHADADVNIVKIVDMLQDGGADLPWHPLSLASGSDTDEVLSIDESVGDEKDATIAEDDVHEVLIQGSHGEHITSTEYPTAPSSEIPPALMKQFLDFGIPGEALGIATASKVLDDCLRWQRMSVSDLRTECRSRMLATHDCVEKGEIVSRLCLVRVHEETEAIKRPELKHVGAWCHGKKPMQYNLLKDGSGQLSFDGPHSTYGRLKGYFEDTGDGWMVAQLTTTVGGDGGVIRIKYDEGNRTMLSNYRSPTMTDWGRDTIARKHVFLSSEASTGNSDFGSENPTDLPSAEGDHTEMEASIEIPDIETTEDLCSAFLAAVARHDLDAVMKGLDREMREAQDVETLVNLMDVEANTVLHHCVSGPRGPGISFGYYANKPFVGTIAAILIKAKGDVNAENLMGETPLLLAVRTPGATPIEAVRLLIEARASPGHADARTGKTTLMEAACRGELQLCQLLLDSRADAAQKNLEGLTARDLAAELGHKNITQLLRLVCPPTFCEEVVRMADELWRVVETFDLAAVDAIIEKLGDDVETIVEMPRGGRTLLHVVSASPGKDDAGEIVRLLVKFVVRLDVKDDAGETPLSLAVSAGIADPENEYAVLDTLRALLHAGAPGNVESWMDPHGDLAVASQTDFGNAISKLLIAFGVALPWFGRPSTESHNEDDDEKESMQDESELRAQCLELGIPFDDVGSAAAKGILKDSLKWRGMRVSELRPECELQHLPTADCVEKNDFVCRLQQVRIWEKASMSFLEKVCRARGVSVAYDFATREEIVEALRSHVFGVHSEANGREQQQCSAKGIPVDRISSDKAMAIYEEMKRLESCKISDLKREYEKFDLRIEAGMEKQDMVNRIRDILVWEALEIPELREECKRRQLPFAGKSRKQLVLSLIASCWATTAGRGSLHQSFFDHKQEEKAPGQEQADQQQQRPRGWEWQEWEKREWEKRAEFNRRQFAEGKRNHAGMPSGQGMPGMRNRFGAKRPEQQRRQQQVHTPATNRSAHFHDLGLPPTATMDEVRTAYRRLALRYHPDKNLGDHKGEAEIAFRRIQHAYESICASK